VNFAIIKMQVCPKSFSLSNWLHTQVAKHVIKARGKNYLNAQFVIKRTSN